MSYIVKKQGDAHDDDSNDFSSKSASIKVPKIKFGANGKKVSTKMMVSNDNPYQSSNPDAQVQGTIVSMELEDDDGMFIMIIFFYS